MKRPALPAALLPAALVASLLFPVGCPSVGGQPVDWQRVAVEMELGASDLREIAAIIDPDEPALAADMIRLAGILDTTSGVLAESGPPIDVIESIDSALALAESLSDQIPDEYQDEAQVVFALVRAGLRRARAYAELEAPAAP